MNKEHPESRPQLVLVPGFSGSVSVDFSFLHPMLDRVFDIVAVDLPPTHNFAELSDVVFEAVRSCISPPVLVGYSVGAVVAAAVASAHPLSISRLALIAGWLTPPAKLKSLALLLERLQVEAPEHVADVIQNAAFSAEGWETVRPVLDGRMTHLFPLAATLDIRAITSSDLPPTMVIGCSHDEVATTLQSKLLFSSLADARYVELDSGHAVVHERPAEILHEIVRFASEPIRSRYSMWGEQP